MKKSKKSSFPIKKIALGIFFLSAVAYYSISRLPRPTRIGINEVSVTQSSPSVTLSLPLTTTSAPNKETSVDIMMDAGGAKVTAAQVELTYDEKQISKPELIQGDFLKNKLGTPKVEAGKISFTYVVPVESGGTTGSGKLATLKFKTLSGNSQIAFTSNTMVAALDLSVNALKSATGTNIVVKENSVPPTPPVLKDIVVVPTPKPTKKPSAAATPTSAKASVKPTATSTPSTPTLKEKDFNYGEDNFSDSLTMTPDPVSPTPKDSAFARFLSFIKAIFGLK